VGACLGGCARVSCSTLKPGPARLAALPARPGAPVCVARRCGCPRDAGAPWRAGRAARWSISTWCGTATARPPPGSPVAIFSCRCRVTAAAGSAAVAPSPLPPACPARCGSATPGTSRGAAWRRAAPPPYVQALRVRRALMGGGRHAAPARAAAAAAHSTAWAHRRRGACYSSGACVARVCDGAARPRISARARHLGSDCSSGRCGQVEMRAPESAPELRGRDGAALEVRPGGPDAVRSAVAPAWHEGRQRAAALAPAQ
jgi:hypothetical protein